MSATSTPKIPLTAELSKFIRKIDSFSFENTSPEISTSTSAPSSQRDKDKTLEAVGDTEQANQERAAVVEKNHENLETVEQQQPRPRTQAVEQQVKEFSVINLRRGRRYNRPRIGSEPIIHFRYQDKIKVSSNIENKTPQRVDMNNCIQTLFNNVPIFSGEESPNISNELNVFLTCCRLAYNSLDTSEEKRYFMKLIPTRLRGRPLDLAQEKEFSNIEDFSKFLKENFTNTKSYLTLNNELRMSQQFPGESLSVYLNRVKIILKACIDKAKVQYPNGADAIKEELDEIGLHSFKMGILNPNHKFFILQDNEKTLEALTPKVLRLEETEKYMFYNNLSATSSFNSPIISDHYTANQPTNFPQVQRNLQARMNQHANPSINQAPHFTLGQGNFQLGTNQNNSRSNYSDKLKCD